jgi:tyrosinase
LTPFWKAEANYWSSDALKDTAALGYSYPEFNNLQGLPPDVVQQIIRQKVDELYGGSVVIGLPGARQEKEGEAQYYDWTARVEFKKNELLTSFTVLFFVGEVPDDPQSWLVSSNLVGTYHAFVNSAARRCANCRDQSDLVVEGFVHLNRGIERLSKLPNFESGRVSEYLQDPSNLKWRVQRVILVHLLSQLIKLSIILG